MTPRHRSPDIDRLIAARLHGAAQRLAVNPAREDDACAELAAIADGRVDLLTEAAGIMLGFHEIHGYPWSAPQAAALLIAAGAQQPSLDHWIQVGRERAARPRHSY